MREPAHAKINLTLRVLGRRSDGLHELESLVAFAALHDDIAVAPSDRYSLVVEGPFAPALASDPASSNLALRAAMVAAIPGGAFAVKLTKNIPVAAGLGGGSADAAAVLRSVGRIQNLPRAATAAFAAGLGADVPVCFESRTAYVAGVGDHVSIAQPLPALPLLLVVPPVALPTSRVFAAWQGGARPVPPPPPGPCGDPAQFVGSLRAHGNDLTAPARVLAPVIDDVLAATKEQPECLLARMSGSGPACFGIFASDAARDAAAARIGGANRGWWVAVTRLRGGSAGQNRPPPA